ncbi:MAG: hypothetical protein KatS3mg102_2492 [Planctomycetota bacterium]|nr:MAG: hypothetical protein KatS3mg102_2492 [Planctomycetota bacterium]
MLCLLSGCATLLAPGPDHVPVDSAPQGATVKLNGEVVGTTPTVVRLDRARRALLSFELPGYRPYQTEVFLELNAVTLLNFLFWPGFIVDGFAGTIECYPETPILASLVPEAAARPEPEASAQQAPPPEPPEPVPAVAAPPGAEGSAGAASPDAPPAAAPAGALRCSYCGKQVRPSDRICPYCGDTIRR